MVLAKIELNNMHVNPYFKNFSGVVKGRYDKQGERYFVLDLDEDLAGQLQSQGWPVKIKPSKDGTKIYRNMKVKVGQYDPPIFQKSDTAMVPLKGDMLNNLDNINIDHVDCILQLTHNDRYDYEGNTCYLDSMMVYQVTNKYEAAYERWKAEHSVPVVDSQTPPAVDAEDLPF